jgi:hypothetical protein
MLSRRSQPTAASIEGKAANPAWVAFKFVEKAAGFGIPDQYLSVMTS